MGTVLQSLRVVAASRPKHLSPAAKRRSKLTERIDQQIQVAQAKDRGEQFTINVSRRKRNQLTGEMVDVSRQRQVKECWWVTDDGKLMLELRYGVRSIEFAKGKSAIEVSGWEQLIPTLEILKTAATSGEFDDQLSAVASRLERQLKAKRT